MRGFDSYLTLQKLEIFCLVVDMQSVTRAAAHLCISQPVVTAHLRGMEEKLGVRLVRRTGRNIALTEAGERVYRWARDVVNRTREIERELASLSSETTGSVLIAASMGAGSYLLPPILIEFYKRFPQGLIQTVISNPVATLNAVREGACDFAVQILAPGQNTQDLLVTRLWEERLLVVSAPHSRWVTPAMQARDLSSVPFISTAHTLVMRELEDLKLREHQVFERKVVMAFGHPEPQKVAVMEDLGLSLFVESSVREDIAAGRLQEVPLPGMAMKIPLFLVQRGSKEMSPFQEVLRRHIIERCASALTPDGRLVRPLSDRLPTGHGAVNGSPRT